MFSARTRLAFVFTLILSALVFSAVKFGPVTEAQKKPEVSLAPIITATKTAVATTDIGSNGAFINPGDTLQYTVTIQNSAPVGPGADATGTIFTDTLSDTNLTLVNTPGSITASPIAADDTFTATGNIPISPAAGVLANDIDPLTGTNAGITVTRVQGAAGNLATATNTTATGIGAVPGSVTMAANGTFTYEPPPGFQGTDTFTYRASKADGTFGDGTVKITITGMAWFIDNSASASLNRGTFSQPFKTIAAFNAINTGAAPNPQPSQVIALRTGAGSYNEADGINLQLGQVLIGGAVAFNTAITADANSTAAYTAFASGTTAAPTITTTAGNGVDLASGNTIKGFNVGTVVGGSKILGSSFGTLTVGTMALSGNGQALDLTTGTCACTFSSITSASSAAAGIKLVGVAGSLTSTGGTTITSPTTNGIFIGGSGNASTLTSNFGNTSVTNGSDQIRLDTIPGATTNFGTLSLTGSATGDALIHTGDGGILTVTGTATITNPANRCILIQNATKAISFQQVDATSCGLTGVLLQSNTNTIGFTQLNVTPDANQIAISATSNTGTITTTSGTVSASNNSVLNLVGASTASRTPLNMTLTSVSGSGATNNVVASNLSGTLTMNGGSFNSTSGAVFTATGDTATISYAGSLTNTALGISLTNNTGGTFTFSGGISLSTGSNAAFTATGGGTVNVCDKNPCGSANSVVNTLTTTTGRPVNASAVTFGANGATFKSISANGGTNGIVLAGTSGNFTVTGDGSGFANSSGGTIQNIQPNGSPSSLGNNPVWLTTVSGTITLKSMTMSIANNTFSGMHLDNNLGGTATVNVTGCTFTGVGGAGNTGQNKALLQFEAGNTGGSAANVTVDVENSFFFNNRTYGMFATAAGDSLLNVTLNQSGFGTDTNTGAPVNNPGTAITNAPPFSLGITNSSNAKVHYNVSNNTFWGARGLDGAIYAVTISGASTTASSTLNGFITNNKLGKAGVSGSGCSNSCSGFGLLPGTSGTFNTTVTGNDIRQINSDGGISIFNSAGGGATTNITAHITNNTLAEPDTTGSPLFLRAILLSPGNSGGANNPTCAEITGNTISGAWTSSMIRPTNNNNSASIRLPGYGGTALDTAAVNAFVSGNNSGAVTSSTAGAVGFVGGAACTTTPLSMPAGEVGLNTTAASENNLAFVNLLNADHGMWRAESETQATNEKRENLLGQWDSGTAAQASTEYAATANADVTTQDPLIAAEKPVGTVGTVGQWDNGTSVANASLSVDAVDPQPQSTGLLAKIGEMISPTVYSQETTPGEAISGDPNAPQSGGTICVQGNNVTTGPPCNGPGFTLPAQKSITITFQATIAKPTANPTTTSVSNQGTVSGGNFTSVLTDDPSVAGTANPTVTTIIQAPTITKAFSPSSVFLNSPATLTFTVTNVNSTQSASQINFSDTFPTSPANLVVANTPNAVNNCGGALVTFTNLAGTAIAAGDNGVKLTGGGPLAAGANCTLKVDVKSNTPGTYQNTTGIISSFEGFTGATSATVPLIIGAATAAGVSVSGRAMTPDGRGIRNAIVVITDSHGVARFATTGTFGSYHFDDVEVGQNYIISVRSKRYHFIPQVITVTDQLTDVDFVAELY